MIKKFAISLFIILNYLGFTSCNSSSDPNYGEFEISSDVAVTGFSLIRNDKILNNLDSVYFSIDLNNARIFNADSLPVGTDVSKLLLSITTADEASKVELKFKTIHNNDTVVDYLENASDSINFSAGPVILHVVAANKETSRDYTIEVNVHKMEPDSLFWNLNSRRLLPTGLQSPTAQKTVEYNGKIICLTSDGNRHSIASTENPDGAWATDDVNFGFAPDVNSFTAADNSLFILDKQGNLYQSADGNIWNTCGTKWHSITGAYGSKLLGIANEGSRYFHATYPETTRTEVDPEFPVEGNSTLFTYSTEWAAAPQVITIGGRNSQGKALAETWAYDGNTWANVSDVRPVAATGMTMFHYYQCTTDTITWRTSKREVLVALGGITDDDTLNRNVYISGDLGFVWKKAGTLMQLPDYIPSSSYAQAIVSTSVNRINRSASTWETFASRRLPFWLITEYHTTTRATAPITEWETPYIYLFGGYDINSKLNNTVWRGAINQLTFKPLQ